ncbi:dTDP-glucose 4,6-dehydratase [Akkermansiaceae bacterium]|nr:dTDP-glucose 4,6-dehydratase [Akkermansiaceae bacterium]
MRFIVTGGAGFIGSNLVKILVEEKGHQVLNLDALTYAGNLASLDSVKDHPAYQFRQGSICDAEFLKAALQDFQPDGVMHLAAESHVDRSIDGPGDFITTNIVGTYTLLQAALEYFRGLKGARQEGFRFLHVSTDEVYGSLGPEGVKFSEKTAYDPHSPYSASKAASDHLVRAWGDTYGLPILVTNCSNNYGPNQFPEKLIPVVLLKALAGDAIPVYGKGENIRDWLYVRDHAVAISTVFEKGRVGETYVIGGDTELRNVDLVRSICRILDGLRPRPDDMKYEEQIEFVTDRPGHDMRYAIDASKIKDELGWKSSETIESGLRKTIEWYLNNEDWWQEILKGNHQFQRLGTAK